MAIKGKKLDPKEQVNSVNKKEENIQEKNLVFVSNIDFGYGIRHAIVNWRLANKDGWNAGVLDINSSKIGYMIPYDQSIVYKVTYGTFSSEELVTDEIATSDCMISIGLDKLKDKQLLELAFNLVDNENVIVKVMPDGNRKNMKTVRWSKKVDGPTMRLLIDKCEHYDVEIDYYGESTIYRETYSKQTGLCFIVKGFCPVRLETAFPNTFEHDIMAIEVNLTYNDTQKRQFFLNHDRQTAYCMFDYEINGDDLHSGAIKLEYTVFYYDGSEKHFDGGTFAGDTRVIGVKAYPYLKTEKEETTK